MCGICIRAIARLLGPTHTGVPFAFDEEGLDCRVFQQDQGYFASDRVPFREYPVIVHFLAGHREALNRRHYRAGSTTPVLTETFRKYYTNFFFFLPKNDNGTNRKRPEEGQLQRSLHRHHADEMSNSGNLIGPPSQMVES